VAVAVLAVTSITTSAGASAPPAGPTDPAPDARAAVDEVTVNSDAYWLLAGDGTVYTFGGVSTYGSLGTAGRTAVDLEPTPDDQGYWILDNTGVVHAFGSAVAHGNADTSVFLPGEEVASISATPTGAGYWIFTDKGRAINRGNATFLGDMSAARLNGPVLDSVPTPTGLGYYMIASDGGVFAFGDARFFGSTGDLRLNQRVVGLTPDPDGAGYWLVAADGGLFAFDAEFRGSVPGALGPNGRLNAPIISAVSYGNAYLMVASDGGVFNFATDLPFQGSLGGQTLSSPIVALGPANGTEVGSGDVRATLTWQNTNDVDLWVVTPDGSRIIYNDRTAQGGTLDVDANPSCSNETTRPVENVFWATGTAPAGTYRVYANLFARCDDNPAATTVTANVVARGQTVFSGQVTPSVENPDDGFADAVLVAEFTL
jgi:hypothetical protein